MSCGNSVYICQGCFSVLRLATICQDYLSTFQILPVGCLTPPWQIMELFFIIRMELWLGLPRELGNVQKDGCSSNCNRFCNMYGTSYPLPRFPLETLLNPFLRCLHFSQISAGHGACHMRCNPTDLYMKNFSCLAAIEALCTTTTLTIRNLHGSNVLCFWLSLNQEPNPKCRLICAGLSALAPSVTNMPKGTVVLTHEPAGSGWILTLHRLDQVRFSGQHGVCKREVGGQFGSARGAFLDGRKAERRRMGPSGWVGLAVVLHAMS